MSDDHLDKPFAFEIAHGERLKELRLKNGMSIRAVAAALGDRVHWTTIGKIERGQMKLTMPWVQRFSEVYNASPLDILGFGNFEKNVAKIPLYGIEYALRGASEIPPPEAYVYIQTDRKNVFAFTYKAPLEFPFKDNGGFICVDADERSLSLHAAYLLKLDTGRLQIGTYSSDPPRLDLWQSDRPTVVIGERMFEVIGRVFYIGQHV